MMAASSAPFAFDNSYARLPDRFYSRLAPTPVAAPRLIRLNETLARHLGLDPDALAEPDGVAILAGNRVPEASEPLAMAYAGHQFGSFVAQLGDGRAILLGEVIDREGVRRDIQLKGSGRTPFSRRGDGRAALGPVLREYIVAEAMAALGIPTTRALAAVSTGESVLREGYSPGAVLTRVAQSHVRVGTFEFFAARGDVDAIRQLADHVIARHYPEAAESNNRYLALLQGVVERQAALIARWMLVGFIHGVMNTDNMSIAGETIDYGPCAFMDAYDPAKVFSSIDHAGRYAYANQPRIAQWNLARFAETLLPLLGADEQTGLEAAEATLAAFAARFTHAHLSGLRAKLGLREAWANDTALIKDLLERMAANGADFTLTFRRLADAARSEGNDAGLRVLFSDPAAFDGWAMNWRTRLLAEGGDPNERWAAMRAVNPMFIPRNHRIEEAIAAAEHGGDFTLFAELNTVLAAPYEDQPKFAHYGDAPRPDQIVTQTFCGT